MGMRQSQIGGEEASTEYYRCEHIDVEQKVFPMLLKRRCTDTVSIVKRLTGSGEKDIETRN